MGYSVHYKPPKEKVDELKSHLDVEATYLIIKSEIIKTCMDNIENIFQFQTIINRCLKNIYNTSKTDAEIRAYNQFQEDGEISFFGWDKSGENAWSNIDDLCISNYYELFVLAMVPTPNYFEDKDNYYEKYQDICVIIDEFRESCFNLAQFELMEKFKEYKDNDC